MLPLKEQGCCHGFYRYFNRYFYYPGDSGAGSGHALVFRIEGQRLRTQVDALATQLREQLDRVEAQQRSMTESVVTL